MDTLDRPDSNVPARYPSEASRPPASIAPIPREMALATPAGPQITPRILLRGLSRHWWRIALGWVVLSTPLAYAIYEVVEPTYEAASLLRAEPSVEVLNDPGLHGEKDMSQVRPYLRTQVQLIKSDKVLDAALARTEIRNLPMVRSSKDPRAELRRDLVVEIVGNDTYLISVALASKDPSEAAAITNAVVDEYLAQHVRYQNTANRALKKTLESERQKLETQIQTTRDKLTAMAEKGDVHASDLNVIKPNEKGEVPSSFTSVDEARYQQTASQLLQYDIQLIDAKAELESLRMQHTKAVEAAAEGERQVEQQAEQQLREQMYQEFQHDPDARALLAEIGAARTAFERARSKVRKPNDPAVVSAQREVSRLETQWGELWDQKRPEIRERLQKSGAINHQPEALVQRIRDAESRIIQIETKRKDLAALVAGMEVKHDKKNSSQLEATFLNLDLTYHRRNLEVIMSKLAQLDFEIGQEAFRITVQDPAAVPQAPSNNKRIKLMALAPVGVLGLMLGLFLLLEIKAERVGDPESLSTRVQSEVYALPPLPTARSIRRAGPAEADDQIEQFIQRLDHLRFAVCGSPAELEKGRCVLITSAVGGEGKTTLAAQLAARCGNAGMSTLLIDADLRRTGLCSLLDIAEGPGLSDALLSDEPAPTELVVPVQGGTFHLLPAGTPSPDTSRILQSRKLGLLIAQFRQLYDLVIIDSPPVLPVPDALILGRWVDGAVLAVRYDISRFPQVERARRQLDGAGIAVLGTVINGMRNSESYYGRYSYNRRRTPTVDTPATY